MGVSNSNPSNDDDKKISNKYGNRRFFMNNLSDIPIKKIREYSSDVCETATLNGKNCKRSMIYEKDNIKLNCIPYCIKNKDTWLEDLFNYPKYATFVESKNNLIKTEVKIIGAIYQFIEETKSKDLLYFDVMIDDDIETVMYKYKDEKRSELYFTDGKRDNIKDIVEDLDLKSIHIINVYLLMEKKMDKNLKLHNFSDRLLKPIHNWYINNNIIALSLSLQDGITYKLNKVYSPFLTK